MESGGGVAAAHGTGGGSGLSFEVLPESCLRNEHIELVLGMPLNHVIAALQNVARLIKNVELVYDNKNPYDGDITITLRNEGIRLYFDPTLQVLKLIEVYDFSNITLHYGDTTFSEPSEAANVSKVENCFGATHPGVYDEDQRIYMLHWRGVSFAFPAKEPSSTLQQRYAHGLGSLHFANSSLPLLERMTVFSGDSPSEMKIPNVPVSCLCGDVFLDHVESIVNERGQITGLQVSLRGEGTKVAHNVAELDVVKRIVQFGDSEESVLSALGAPSKVYYKSDEKMLIQRGSSSENLRNADKPDFFFNYFALGLDILFDSDSRRVLKFVLHTNIPGHFDFAIYTRCNFKIAVERDLGEPLNRRLIAISTTATLESFNALFPAPENGVSDVADGGGSDTSSLSSAGDASDGGASRRVPPRAACRSIATNGTANNNNHNNKSSIILNKCTSAVGALEGSENPFGSTFCYGTDQIIVEVMDNSYIASVILYE